MDKFLGAKLQRAKLNSATLQEPYFRDANLQEADLSRLNLQGASFMRANLKTANLQGANLQGADLSRANLEGANLQKASLKGANLMMTDLRKADLTDTNVREAQNWTSAIYDAKMLKMLGLKPNHNEELIRSLGSEKLKRTLLKTKTQNFSYESDPKLIDEKARGQRPGDLNVTFYPDIDHLTSNQYAQITIATFKDNNPCSAGIVLRGSPMAYYAFVALKNDARGYTTRIYKNVHGQEPELAVENSTQWKAGDVLRAAAAGTNLTLYRNGLVVLNTSDAATWSGQAGIVIGCHSGDVVNAEIKSFLAGDLWKGR